MSNAISFDNLTNEEEIEEDIYNISKGAWSQAEDNLLLSIVY